MSGLEVPGRLSMLLQYQGFSQFLATVEQVSSGSVAGDLLYVLLFLLHFDMVLPLPLSLLLSIRLLSLRFDRLP
jgi:hypothetical protein